MDARYLTQADRDKLKLAICTRREEVGKVIQRMEAKHWYTDDCTLQCLQAAYHSLHAAVQAIGALDGLSQHHRREGPHYPLDERRT